MPSQLAAALMRRKEEAVGHPLRYATDQVSEVAQTGGGRPVGSVEFDGRFYEPMPGVAVCCDEVGARMLPQALTQWWGRRRITTHMHSNNMRIP